MAEPDEPQGNEPDATPPEDSPEGKQPEGTPPEGTSPAEREGAGESDLARELAKWKAMARQMEKAAKKGEAAEKRLAEIDDANKSELEKAQEAARVAQQRAEAAELEILRLQVASRKGLTEGQAKRLQGSNQEELEADADELLAAFKPPETPRNGSGAEKAPVPRLTPGAVKDAGPVETDPAKLAAAIPRRGLT